MIAAEVLLAWLLADFITGVVHWIEDRYLSDGTKNRWLRSLADDNELHHQKPTAMLLGTWWQNMQASAMVAWPLALLSWWLAMPLVIWLGIAFSAFGNLVHRFAHEPIANRSSFVRFMQTLGLFVSPSHHEKHHRYRGKLLTKIEASRSYCPMTDWLNPWLDAVRFWANVEIFLAIFGLRTVADRGDQ